MKYYEIAIGAPSNRGILIESTELQKYISKAQSLNVPLYKSYYTFKKDAIKHFQIRKSIRGFTGEYELETIIFDIDKKTDTDSFVNLRAKEFVLNLIEKWKLNEEQILCWYSGNGYHIEIPNIFEFKNELNTIKGTLNHYFPEADSIYDLSRLIRVGNTINQKNNRFKIHIPTEHFLQITYTEILTLAKTSQLTFPSLPSTFPLYPERKIIEKIPKHIHNTMLYEPSKILTCMQKLYNKGSEIGSRHAEMLPLISAYRRAGVPPKGILAMISHWAPTIEQAEIERNIHYVFDKDIQYTCKSSIFEKYCDPKCFFYKNKNYSPVIHSSDTMEKAYTKFIRTDFANKAFNLATLYDIDDFVCYPGELIFVIGDTKLGKSAWVQNLCVDIPMSILYLSLEMHERLTFRRFIQIAHGMSKAQVDDYYKIEDNGLSEKIKHIKVMSIAPNINDIAKIIVTNNPKIVVIDVIDAIEVKGMDMETKIGPIVTKLKALAQELDIIIIAIHHISKQSSRAKLDIHSGKGSSSTEQKADKIIAIEGIQSSSNRLIQSLGARDEKPFKIKTQMSFKTFRFRQIIEE